MNNETFEKMRQLRRKSGQGGFVPLQGRNGTDRLFNRPGTGKSYLATALEYQACQTEYRVMYVNMAKLMGQLKLAKAKGTILSELKKIECMDLLLLDEFGLQPSD